MTERRLALAEAFDLPPVALSDLVEAEEDGLAGLEAMAERGAGVEVCALGVFAFFEIGRTGLTRVVERRGKREDGVIPFRFAIEEEEEDDDDNDAAGRDDFALDCEEGCEDDADEAGGAVSTCRYFFSVGVRVSWKLIMNQHVNVRNDIMRGFCGYLAQWSGNVCA